MSYCSGCGNEHDAPLDDDCPRGNGEDFGGWDALQLDDGTPDTNDVPRQGRFLHDRVFLRAPAGTDPLVAMRAAMAVFMERGDSSDDATVIGRVIDATAIEATATEETDEETDER